MIIRKMKSEKCQMSDSQSVMLFLTISGGLQDAYTYWVRNHVFANAQTGNIVLLTGHLFKGEFVMGLRYLIPVFSFAMGVLAAEQIHGRFKYNQRVHWRQLIVFIEAVFLFTSGLIPTELSYIANAMISFACAMQIEAFKKVYDCNYASTMCIGNLRSCMEAFSIWLRNRNPQMRNKACRYLSVILFFAIGGGLGTILSPIFGIRTIWFSSLLLMITFLLMAF